MTLPDELARESMTQLLRAMRELPEDAPANDRMKLVNEASRLLERIEAKTTQYTHLGAD